jgi:hypothetical protein
MYNVFENTKNRALFITKVVAVSKDGYEKEISRVESKRNLFKFIKTYLLKETNFVSDPEEYWWKRKVYHKRKDIEESLHQFILNAAPSQEQEEFAYEGIFDQKKKKETVMVKASRKDLFKFINPLNKKRVAAESVQLKTSVSSLIKIQDEVSSRSISPCSRNSNALGRKVKGDLKFDVVKKIPTAINGSFHDYTIRRRKVTKPKHKGSGKLHNYRSVKQIQISRLHSRKRSETLEKNMANKLVNEANQEKTPHYEKIGSQRVRHDCSILKDKSDASNLLFIPKKTKTIMSKDSNGSQSKTDKKHPSDDNDKGNYTPQSSAQAKYTTDPLPKVIILESNEVSIDKNPNIVPKEEVKTTGTLNKCDSISVPLNDSNEFGKEKPDTTQRKEDLGIILEEQSSYSTIIQFNQSKNNKNTLHSTSSKAEIGKSLTGKIPSQNAKFILQGGTLNDSHFRKQYKDNSKKSINEEFAMKDPYGDLNKISTPNKDIQEVSEEISRIDGSEPVQYSDSSQMSIE